MKVIIEKVIEIKRNPNGKHFMHHNVPYIGMNSRITTIKLLQIPIYKKVELFAD